MYRFATFVLFRATNSNRLKIFFLIFKKYDLSIPFFEICSVLPFYLHLCWCLWTEPSCQSWRVRSLALWML
jgi:hypothetical protein